MKQEARSKTKKAAKRTAKAAGKPAPRKPQRRDAEATKERIMAVATRMFAEKGYDGASIKEICREAKVNMAAIHYHFESRENLYKSLISKFGGTAIDAALRSLQPAGSLEEFKTRLNIFLNEWIVSANEQPEIALMIIRDLQSHPELLADFFEKTFGRLQEALLAFFRSAQEKGILDPSIIIEMAAGTLQAQLHFVIGNRRLFKIRHGFDLNDPEHRQFWVRTIIDLYVDGVRRRV